MPAPKSVSEKILAAIQAQTAEHNVVLARNEIQHQNRHKEMLNKMRVSDQATAKQDAVSEEQAGQEVQMTKVGQHQTGKLLRETETHDKDDKGLQKEHSSLLEDGWTGQGDWVDYANKLQEEANEDNKDANKDNKDYAAKAIKLSAELKAGTLNSEKFEAYRNDAQVIRDKNILNRTEGGNKLLALVDRTQGSMKKDNQLTFKEQRNEWVKQGKGRLQEMANMDTFTGALKTDMSLIFGSLGGLQSMPGVQTVLSGIKFILSWAFLKLIDIFTKTKMGKRLVEIKDSIKDAFAPIPGGVKDATSPGRPDRGGDTRENYKKMGRVPKGQPGAGRFLKKAPAGSPVGAGGGGGAFGNAFKEGFGGKIFQQSAKDWMKGTKAFKLASSALTKTMTFAGKILGIAAKGIRIAIMAMGTAFTTIIGAIMSPIGLIVIGIILLGVGLYLAWDWVKTKWNEGVEKVKEFGTMFKQFLSDSFKSLGLKLRGAWVSVMEGLQNAINWVIEKINKIPGVNIDKVDFAGSMRTDLDADKAAFEAEKASRGQEIEDGSTAVRSAGGGTGTGGGDNQVVSNNVTNINKQSSYEVGNTSPGDSIAAQAAAVNQ